MFESTNRSLLASSRVDGGWENRLPCALKTYSILAALVICATCASSTSADPIFDHRVVNSTLAYGTVSVDGGTFADLNALFLSNVVSEQVANDIGDNYFGGPPFEALVDDFATVSNLEFLIGPLTYLGDPVIAVEDAFAAFLADINVAIGGGATLSTDTTYQGMVSSALYGGIITEPPQTRIVTGDSNVAV